MGDDINVCRLCLDVIDNIEKDIKFVSIENSEDILGRLKLLALPCLKNLDAIENPVICTKCNDKLSNFTDFKNSLITNQSNKNSGPNADTLSRNTNELCRLCIKCSEVSDELRCNWKDINTLLFQCGIQLNFKIEGPLKICNQCESNLNDLSKFIQVVSENENYISDYFKRPEKLGSKEIATIVSIRREILFKDQEHLSTNSATKCQIIGNEKISVLNEVLVQNNSSNSITELQLQLHKEVDKTGKINDNEKVLILREMSKKIEMKTTDTNESSQINSGEKSCTKNHDICKDNDVEVVCHDTNEDNISGRIKKQEKSMILEEMSRKIQSNEVINLFGINDDFANKNNIDIEYVRATSPELNDNDECMETSFEKKLPRTYGKAKMKINKNNTILNPLPKATKIEKSKNIDAENINVADVTLTTLEEYNSTIHGIEHIDDILKINKQLDENVVRSEPKVPEPQIYIVNFETMSLNPCDDDKSSTNVLDKNYSIEIITKKNSKTENEIVEPRKETKKCSNIDKINPESHFDKRNRTVKSKPNDKQQLDFDFQPQLGFCERKYGRRNKLNKFNYTNIDKLSDGKLEASTSKKLIDSVDETSKMDTENDNAEIDSVESLTKKRGRKSNTVGSNEDKIIPKKKPRILNESIIKINQNPYGKTYQNTPSNSRNKDTEYKKNVQSQLVSVTLTKKAGKNQSELESASDLANIEFIATNELNSSEDDDYIQHITGKKKRLTRSCAKKVKGQQKQPSSLDNSKKISTKQSTSKNTSTEITDDQNECELDDLDGIEFVAMDEYNSSEDEAVNTSQQATDSNKKKKRTKPVLRIIRSTRKTTNKEALDKTWQELTSQNVGQSSTSLVEPTIVEPKKRGRKPKANKEQKKQKSTYLECNSCSYKTISKNSLIQHQYIHTVLSNVTTFNCSSCQFKTTDEELLKQHQATHASSTLLFGCVFCDYSNKKKVSVMNHTLHHDDKDVSNLFYCLVMDHFNTSEHYECFQCAFQTTNEAEMPDHVIDHRRVDPIKNPVIAKFSCNQCDYKTKSGELLQRHQKLNHDRVKNGKVKNEITSDNPSGTKFNNKVIYTCEICPYKTFHERSLSNHKSMKHYRKKPEKKETGDTFFCAECPYVTHRKVNLARHALVHKTKDSMEFFECAHCYFETKHRRSYTRHMQVRHQVIV